MERHLCPAILSYIKRRQENPNSSKTALLVENGQLYIYFPSILLLYIECAKLGLQEDWIIEHIKRKDAFQRLPTSKIIKAIDRLVERSEIYPVANRVYSYLK